jgi:hypothetical protein
LFALKFGHVFGLGRVTIKVKSCVSHAGIWAMHG